MFIYFYLIFHNYVNRLKVEKLEAMAKLHTHYITNAQKELKYAYAGVSEVYMKLKLKIQGRNRVEIGSKWSKWSKWSK